MVSLIVNIEYKNLLSNKNFILSQQGNGKSSAYRAPVVHVSVKIVLVCAAPEVPAQVSQFAKIHIGLENQITAVTSVSSHVTNVEGGTLLQCGMKNVFELFVSAHQSVEDTRSIQICPFIGIMGYQYGPMCKLVAILSSAGSMKQQVISFRTKI